MLCERSHRCDGRRSRNCTARARAEPIEEVAAAIGKITGRKPGPIKREFLQVAHKVTAAEMEREAKALELEARETAKKAKPRAAGDEED